MQNPNENMEERLWVECERVERTLEREGGDEMNKREGEAAEILLQ